MRTAPYVALAVAGLVGCDRVVSAEKAPTFDVELKWTLNRDEYSFTYRGKGYVTGSDTSGVYLVALEMRRIKRLDPSEKPDTVYDSRIMARGRALIETMEYASRCSQLQTVGCIRAAAEPDIAIRVIGWAPLSAVAAR